MMLLKKIVAAFREMHVSPAKHSYASVTDGQTTDKVIPMCRYASQATQLVFSRTHVAPEKAKLDLRTTDKVIPMWRFALLVHKIYILIAQ